MPTFWGISFWWDDLLMYSQFISLLFLPNFLQPSMAAHCKMVGYKMGEQWLWTAIYLLTEQRVSGGSADVCHRRSCTSHDYKCGSFAIVVTFKPLELRSPSAPGAIEPLGFVIEEWIWLHGCPFMVQSEERRQTIYGLYWKVCLRVLAWIYKSSSTLWPWSSLPVPHRNYK